MKLLKTFLSLTLLSFAYFAITVNTYAQGPDLKAIEGAGLPGFRFKDANLGSVIQFALPWIFALSGTTLLFYLLYGGVSLMLSGGDPKVVEGAKGKITNALTGFAIIFVAFWLIQLIARIFGLQAIVNIFG